MNKKKVEQKTVRRSYAKEKIGLCHCEEDNNEDHWNEGTAYTKTTLKKSHLKKEPGIEICKSR
jgi:hypothetical protein